jgi:hypothetical protein
MVVVLTPHRLLPFVLDVPAWVRNGDEYLRTHVRAAVWGVALVFVVAVLLAYGLYRLRGLRKPAEFSSQGDVWIHSIGERPAGKHPYVGLQLNDGRLIEGPLHSFTFGAEAGKRDIALSGPIRVTEQGSLTPVTLSNLDRLVVPEAKIESITVIHVPARTT